MLVGRICDHQQSQQADASAAGRLGLQPVRLEPSYPAAFAAGSWCIPRFSKGIPVDLTMSEALAPKHMAAFALAAQAQGVKLPEGPFTGIRDTLLQQWSSYIDAACGKHDPVAMNMTIEADEKRLRVLFSAQSQLNTFRLKPVISRLNAQMPGLGWLVYEVLAHASKDHFPIYDLWHIGRVAAYMWFRDSWTDEEMAEELRTEDPDLKGMSLEEIKATYDQPWPSDLIAAVDGHAWMLRQKCSSQAATQQDAATFLETEGPDDLKAVVTDALALQKALGESSFLTKGELLPRASDLDPRGGDEPVWPIGATCFVVWDDPDYSWEAASHFEEYEMNGGECTEIFCCLRVEDPTNSGELAKLVATMQEVVKHHALVSRLLQHFSKE